MNKMRLRCLLQRSIASFAGALLMGALTALSLLPARAQVSVLTQHNDNSRTGANLQETILTPSNVNTATFGRLFTVNVDGQIYAQPLYVPKVAISGKGTHNVVYIATMHNNLYALDADNGTILWSKNFGTPVPASDLQCCCPDISDQVGILGTPVIDPTTNIIYFVSRNKNTNGTYHQWLNAISILDGTPKLNGPKEIKAVFGGLTFDPKIQNQRPAATLANGKIYLAWASHNDCNAYHGWVMAYSASNLSQVAVYVDTPTGSMGGIWQSGQGLVVDDENNVYFSSGNGSFSTDGANTGNSFVRLSPTLSLLDWFTPFNSDTLNAGDQDLGSAGVLGLPGTHYLVGGGKQGVLYVVDVRNMSHFHSGGDQVVQSFQAIFGNGTSHIHGTPIYYNSPKNGPTIYVWGENDYLRAYAYNATTNRFNTTAIAKSTMTAPVTNANGAMPGGFLSLSANGAKAGTGIIWATTPFNANANNAVVEGIVHAFNADTLQELWNDKQSGGNDEIGNLAKFCPPTVANGKVYVPSFGAVGSTNGVGALVVYGAISTPSLPNYPAGFVNATGLTFNGSAVLNSGLLELTDGNTDEAGSVFFDKSVNITSFLTGFKFHLTNPNADGITFTVQGVGPTALGGLGGGLGYGPAPGASGPSIAKSAAIKFDLYNNSGEGADSTGLFTNGALPTVPAINLTNTGINLHSGHVFLVWVAYSGTTLTATITDMTTSATFTHNYTVNLPALIGGNLGYVGFTGGTGGLTAIQEILAWTFSN